ncbi:MFS transporter [Azoarcus sp. KH32C]|uniref:MFS transporter n=1 Tax=Azoarcus sp. KH32C TaxID=748247 RepID=UPI0002385B7B|nr:MFS transporter [Azoarcus sp. KH32C]BAL27246.1 major facilitator superfamily MFS_1 [Azoarcus sp. KH32C]
MSGSGHHRAAQRPLMLLLALITGIEFLESAMFVFSSSHIMGGIHATPHEFARIPGAYAVASMLAILNQERLARYFGYRAYLSASLALFLVGAVLCAASGGVNELMAARFIQGLGGGAFFTGCRVLINLMLGAVERPRALRYFMIGIFGVSAGGPVLSATLIEHYEWRAVFLGVLPLTLVALIGALKWLPAVKPRREAAPWEWQPLLLFAAAAIALQWALTESRFDFFSEPLALLGLAAVGVLLSVGFIRLQWTSATPLLHLPALRHPTYLTGLGLYCLHYFLSNFSGYLVPVFAERALGLPLATTGWLLSFTATVSLATVLVYVFVLARRFPSKKPLMLTGLVALLASSLWFAALPPDAPAIALLPALAAKGMFGVLLVIPVAGLTYKELAEEHFGHAYQSKNLLRQLAVSLGQAVAAIMVQRVTAIEAEPLRRTVGAGKALTELVDHQALFLACEDLFRLLAMLALGSALIVFWQRRLR